MKLHFCIRRAIFERDVQPLDPYGLKLPLLHGYIVDLSKLVMSA